MSLDTVLKIGKVLRNSNNSLKYFKYVQPCPRDKKGNSPLCLSFKVNDDFSIDFNCVSIIPENQRDKLYYLTFKTSDNDGLVKYLYGDIYYEHYTKLEKNEGGYYRLANPNHSNKAFQSSSFYRGKTDFASIDTKSRTLSQIRTGIEKSIERIETILKYSSAIECYFENNTNISFIDYISDTQKLYNIVLENNYKNINKSTLKKFGIFVFPQEDPILRKRLFDLTNGCIFIHFDYNNAHWYDFKDCFDVVSMKMFEEFVDQDIDNKYVLKKSLYKNLCSGDSKNDIQFPLFKLQNKSKSRAFSEDEINYLFYGKEYSDRGKSISKDFKLIVLPAGDNLSESDYLIFSEKRNEQSIVMSNEYKDSFFDFTSLDNNNITVFDLILTKKGGKSPDSDLVEISGIEKSKLRNTKERISEIAHNVYNERKKEIGTEKELYPLAIEYSFLNILGNPQYDEKTKKMKFVENSKFQSHLIKVLPLIYTDNYIHDDVLLCSFIRNVEYSIRSGDTKYIFLKYDLKFLLDIQNNQNNKYMQITESKSYRLGLSIGRMCKPLKKSINSFEKNYVGMLTRRVATKDDCIQFINDVTQKLIMHEKVWGTFAAEVCNELANLSTNEYDKDSLAFGFFEGYFKYEPTDKRKDFQSRLEKILADYEGNEDFTNEISKLKELTNELNNKQ